MMAVNNKSGSVSFNIEFDQSEKIKKCPKILKSKSKAPLTLDEIRIKQELADMRRKEKIAARLKRMQEREEATKALATNVGLLLEQESLRNGELKESCNIKKMSQRDLLKTANNVAVQFKQLQTQILRTDLTIDHSEKTAEQLDGEKVTEKKQVDGEKVTEKEQVDGGEVAKEQVDGGKEEQEERVDGEKVTTKKQVDEKKMEREEQENESEVKKEQMDEISEGTVGIEGKRHSGSSSKGVSFEVSVNEEKKRRQPKFMSKRKTRTTMTVEEMFEKQQQADKRRQRRLEEKVIKTRERLEETSTLRQKMNVYKAYQEAKKNGEEHEISEPEAAFLANDIAQSFTNIGSRYQTSLDKAQEFSMLSYHMNKQV